MALGLIGFFIFGICLIFLIWALVKKKTKRWWALGMLAGFIMFFVGVIMSANSPPTDITAQPPTSTPPPVTQTSDSPNQTTLLSTTTTGGQSTTNSPVGTTHGPAKELEVYFFDVGQGDAELLRIGDDTMLIDAGPNASASILVNNLKTLGINDIDYVIATHPHEDHIGGLDEVIESFEIGDIYMPSISYDTKTYQNVLDAMTAKSETALPVIPGYSFNLGEAKCVFYAPNSPKYDDTNNYSVVIRVDYGESSFLFQGDAEDVSENEMIAKGFDLDVDVLKVGHHGSDSSSTLSFLNSVTPEIAVIEVGEGNTYGHPTQNTLDKLNAAGASIYRTDLDGDIEITSDGVIFSKYTHIFEAEIIALSSVETTPLPSTTTTTEPIITITNSGTSNPTTTTTSTPVTSTPAKTTTSTTTTTTVNANLILHIMSVTSPVNAGSNATLVAKTSPGAQCTITVYYKSGASTAAGLEPKTADSDGNVSWTWKVGTRTTPGTWSIVVMASKNDQAKMESAMFTVE